MEIQRRKVQALALVGIGKPGTVAMTEILTEIGNIEDFLTKIGKVDDIDKNRQGRKF